MCPDLLVGLYQWVGKEFEKASEVEAGTLKRQIGDTPPSSPPKAKRSRKQLYHKPSGSQKGKKAAAIVECNEAEGGDDDDEDDDDEESKYEGKGKGRGRRERRRKGRGEGEEEVEKEKATGKEEKKGKKGKTKKEDPVNGMTVKVAKSYGTRGMHTHDVKYRPTEWKASRSRSAHISSEGVSAEPNKVAPDDSKSGK